MSTTVQQQKPGTSNQHYCAVAKRRHRHQYILQNNYHCTATKPGQWHKYMLINTTVQQQTGHWHKYILQINTADD
jgi:hypothetical protein